jgi:hypothetical protein
MGTVNKKNGRLLKPGVLGAQILYLNSTLNTDSENICPQLLTELLSIGYPNLFSASNLAETE